MPDEGRRPVEQDLDVRRATVQGVRVWGFGGMAESVARLAGGLFGLLKARPVSHAKEKKRRSKVLSKDNGDV